MLIFFLVSFVSENVLVGHVGKTGGSALKKMLLGRHSTPKVEYTFLTHEKTKLAGKTLCTDAFPYGNTTALIMGVRSPPERFLSAWIETINFSAGGGNHVALSSLNYATPSSLMCAYNNGEDAAMKDINRMFHVKNGLQYYFGDAKTMAERTNCLRKHLLPVRTQCLASDLHWHGLGNDASDDIVFRKTPKQLKQKYNVTGQCAMAGIEKYYKEDYGILSFIEGNWMLPPSCAADDALVVTPSPKKLRFA